MKYNWIEEESNTRTLLQWFILSAMSKHAEGGRLVETFTPPGEKFDATSLDVKMLINDVEVPVVPVFQLIGERLDQMVAAEARRQIQEKLDGVLDEVEALRQRVLETFPAEWRSSNE